MPEDFNPTPTAPPAATTFRILDDGDQVNMDALFKEAVPGVKPKLTLALLLNYVFGIARPTATTRVESGLAFDYTASPTYIFMPGAGGYPIPKGDHILQPLKEPPDGATLGIVTVSIDPAAHGSLPQNMPTLKVWKIAHATGAATQIGSTATDSSASTGAYNAAHTIATASLAAVIDRATYSYYTEVTIESGTNSDDSTSYIGIKSTWSF